MKPPDTAVAADAHKPVRHATTHHQYDKQLSHQHGKRAAVKGVESVAADVFNHASHAFHVAEGVQDLRNEEVGLKSDKLANTYGLMSNQRQDAVAELERETQESAAKIIQKYTRKYLRISFQRRLQVTEDNELGSVDSDVDQHRQRPEPDQEPTTRTGDASEVQDAVAPVTKKRTVQRLCQFPTDYLDGEMSAVDEEVSQYLQQETSSPHDSNRCSDVGCDMLAGAAATSTQQSHTDRTHTNSYLGSLASCTPTIPLETAAWQGKFIARGSKTNHAGVSTAAAHNSATHRVYSHDNNETSDSVLAADNSEFIQTEGRVQANSLRMHPPSPDVANVASRYMQVPQHYHQQWTHHNDFSASRAIQTPICVLVQQPTTTPLEMQVTQLSRGQTANAAQSRTFNAQDRVSMPNRFPSQTAGRSAGTTQLQQQQPTASRYQEQTVDNHLQTINDLLHPNSLLAFPQCTFDRSSRRVRQQPTTWQVPKQAARPGSVGTLSGLPLTSPGPFQSQKPRASSEQGILVTKRQSANSPSRPMTSGEVGSTQLVIGKQHRRFCAYVDEGHCRRSWEGPSPLHRQLLLSVDNQDSKSEPLTKLFHPVLAPADNGRRSSLSIVEMVPYRHATETCVQAVRGWGGQVAQLMRPASPLHSPTYPGVTSNNHPHNPITLEVEARKEQLATRLDKSPATSPSLHQITREAYAYKGSVRQSPVAQQSNLLLNRREPAVSKQPRAHLAYKTSQSKPANVNKTIVLVPEAIDECSDNEAPLLFQRVL